MPEVTNANRLANRPIAEDGALRFALSIFPSANLAMFGFSRAVTHRKDVNQHFVSGH
jgi:hypothetical protein